MKGCSVTPEGPPGQEGHQVSRGTALLKVLTLPRAGHLHFQPHPHPQHLLPPRSQGLLPAACCLPASFRIESHTGVTRVLFGG